MNDVALWRLHVELEDRPGRLGELATAIGGAGCNILSLHVVGEPTDDGAVTDELLVKVPEGTDPAAVVASVEQAGIPCTLLVRADATELADPATTALALARMVAADPGSAPRAVATMLRAQLVDPAIDQPGHVHTLRVGTQQLRLSRAWPFTATELSRAAALLELAAQLSLRGDQQPGGEDQQIVALPDGSQVRLRTATPTDGPLVAALHARCSPATRRARFLSPTPQLRQEELDELLGIGSGQAILAVTVDGGSAVGIVTLSDPDLGVSRFGVLVEDAWQGRGLGTALMRRAAERAAAAGAAELTGVVRPDGVGVTRLLRRAGMLRPSAEMVGDEVHLHAHLAPVPVG
ncbi:Acetyltransferase (GNAT) domain-containing protein [Pseudonocardia thermophila]|jgi:Predicted acetyltransferase|uniref:Acetyltransferase (GNAT) domain-containing protein n=1 Tax=Pseudonocardia thermophila TaxID=1848 RepID=A0A1M6SG01_PSETH|nr:GNAT family N-acetyltransferase [Pseudonocardia thermophila]SHK43661.1 Acetyltransferase (GNAT) domain-containing protein [Pseudonocardia thermophila]